MKPRLKRLEDVLRTAKAALAASRPPDPTAAIVVTPEPANVSAIYFAQPDAASQRGTNENTNGLVRQYVPNGTDLTATSHRAVAAIESSPNDRPRKRLGYRTPREVLSQYAKRRRVAFDVCNRLRPGDITLK